MAANKKNKPGNAAPRPVQSSTVAAAPPAARQIVKDDSPMTAALKEEALVWMLTMICSVIVYIIAANIIHSVYHPDVDALKAEASKILYDISAVRPEPVESMLFRSGVVIILLSLLGFYRLFSKMQALRDQAGKLFNIVAFVCVAIVAALIYLDFAAANPYAAGGAEVPQNVRDFHQELVDGKVVDFGTSNFEFFFHGFFLGNNLLLYTFILTPAIACLFFIGVKKYNWGGNKLVGTGVHVIAAVVILALIAMHTFYFPYTFENKYDFNAVYYSMTQVYSGVPLLVNGFTNTYGLYPEFLNPVFKVMGLSVLNFSMVMALLVGASFFFNYYVLNKFTSNKFILLSGFLTVVFFPYLDFKMATSFDSIFAQFPVRYIVLSTVAFLAALYFQKQSTTLYWVTFGIMGFFILWNPEIGTVSYLCWTAANIYHDFYGADGKVAIKRIGIHAGVAVGTAIAVVLIYKGLCLAIYGASPDMSLLFSTITVFGKIGFNMLPMVLVHPWNLAVVVLIVGFTYAISKLLRKQVDGRAAMVFLLSLLGTGYFMYFQGRSHNWPFAYSTSFTIMLLVILGDELWAKIKDSNILPLNALFVVFLFVISFSFFDVALGAGKINQLISQEDDKANNQEEQTRIENNIDFIQKNSAEKERMHVFSAAHYQGLYFGGSKRISAFNPGNVEMFLKTDMARFENVVADSPSKIFVEPDVFINPGKYRSGIGIWIRPQAAMAATYEVNTVSKTMAMLTKRQTKIPANEFFAGGDDVVLHKKYNDDAAGTHARISDALGMTQVAVGTSFSLELLFKTAPQLYPFATVAGNMNDTSGFIVASVQNAPAYFFGVNGKGLSVPVPTGQWAYCVMNVFPDKLEVYVNGTLAGSMPLATPARQSPEKMCIGNLGFMRYFIGAIAEVAVRNRPLDAAHVTSAWDQIKSVAGAK